MGLKTLVAKKILGTFYEKEFQNTNQTESRTEKLIKKKGDELFVK